MKTNFSSSKKTAKFFNNLFVSLCLLLLAVQTIPVTGQPRNNLYFKGDFEEAFLYQYSDLGAAWHELSWVSSPVRVPGKAMYAHININERNVGGPDWRAQLWHHGNKTTQVNNNTFFMGGDTTTGVHGHNVWRWYGFSMYVPNDWVNDSVNEEIAWNLHEDPDPCETWRFGPLDMKISNDRFLLQTAWDSRPCTPSDLQGVGSATVMNVPLEKGKWVDFVFFIRWDYRTQAQGGQGFIQIWKDGVQQPTYYGPNCYNDQKPVYLTVGPYRWLWNNTAITDRYLYIDEVRIGQGHAVYADVAPGRSPIGHIDSVNSITGLVSGWTLDPDTPNESNLVHFYIDGTFVGSVKATVPRPDVNQNTGYSGDHGYTFTIPSQYLDGNQHTITAYGLDLNGNYNSILTGSPFTYPASVCNPSQSELDFCSLNGGWWNYEECYCQYF